MLWPNGFRFSNGSLMHIFLFRTFSEAFSKENYSQTRSSAKCIVNHTARTQTTASSSICKHPCQLAFRFFAQSVVRSWAICLHLNAVIWQTLNRRGITEFNNPNTRWHAEILLNENFCLYLQIHNILQLAFSGKRFISFNNIRDIFGLMHGQNSQACDENTILKWNLH